MKGTSLNTFNRKHNKEETTQEQWTEQQNEDLKEHVKEYHKEQYKRNINIDIKVSIKTDIERNTRKHIQQETQTGNIKPKQWKEHENWYWDDHWNKHWKEPYIYIKGKREKEPFEGNIIGKVKGTWNTNSKRNIITDTKKERLKEPL